MESGGTLEGGHLGVGVVSGIIGKQEVNGGGGGRMVLGGKKGRRMDLRESGGGVDRCMFAKGGGTGEFGGKWGTRGCGG